MKNYIKALNLIAGALVSATCGALAMAQDPQPLLSGQDTASGVSAVPEDVVQPGEAEPVVLPEAESVPDASPEAVAAAMKQRYRDFARNVRVLNGIWHEDAAFDGDESGRRSLAGALGLEYLGGTKETVRLSGDLSGIEAVLSSEDRDVLILQMVMRQKVAEASRVVSGDSLFWDFTDALFDIEVDQRVRLAIYSGILPDLVRAAQDGGDDIRARKFRMQRDTIAYHWGNLEPGVMCAWDGADVAFVFSLADIGSKGTFEAHVVPRGAEFSGEGISCRVTVREMAAMTTVADVEDALDGSLRALQAKDADAVAEDVLRLTRSLEGFVGRYGQPSVLNDDWEGAPLERWLSELDVIRLMLVAQTRFATNDRLERVVRKIWPEATFYQRVCRFDASRKVLKGAFAAAAGQLWDANGASYRWIADHMDPKKIKKLDKSFAAWTKAKKKDATLSKRLLGAWTMWSLGDYARAASYAGDVAEGKSRLVHPQLHSFDIMLRAVRGEDISEEALGTYIRVISLKVPSLAYETLSAAGRWFKPSMRNRIVGLMRAQEPSLAPAAAVEFYREYAPELRRSWDSAHCMRIDAWLEQMLRPTENALMANRRRLEYLDALVGAGDVPGVAALSVRALRERQTMLPQWASFWENIQVLSGQDALAKYRECVKDVKALTLLGVSEVNDCLMTK